MSERIDGGRVSHSRWWHVAAMAAVMVLTLPTVAVTAFASDHNTGRGANTSGPFDPHNVGQGDNQGNGNAPANGTVGNADDKNPPGQVKNGGDSGYECDDNSGVGNNGGNPAHSGCAPDDDACPDGDHNGDMEGCEAPPEECPDGDHNGDMEGCEAPPEECPDGDHNGDMEGCEAPPVDDNPVDDNPVDDNPVDDNPGNNNPGDNNPGGNSTTVLGAQASTGAAALSDSSSGAPSAGAPSAGSQPVPSAVEAGIAGADPASTGSRSAMGLLMVAFGLFAIGMAITPSRRRTAAHRRNG
jgi:hypothetical protein